VLLGSVVVERAAIERARTARWGAKRCRLLLIAHRDRVVPRGAARSAVFLAAAATARQHTMEQIITSGRRAAGGGRWSAVRQPRRRGSENRGPRL